MDLCSAIWGIDVTFKFRTRSESEFFHPCKLKLIAISHLRCAIERFGDANRFRYVVRKGGTKFHGNLHSGYPASEAL